MRREGRPFRERMPEWAWPYSKLLRGPTPGTGPAEASVSPSVSSGFSLTPRVLTFLCCSLPDYLTYGIPFDSITHRNVPRWPPRSHRKPPLRSHARDIPHATMMGGHSENNSCGIIPRPPNHPVSAPLRIVTAAYHILDICFSRGVRPQFVRLCRVGLFLSMSVVRCPALPY